MGAFCEQASPIIALSLPHGLVVVDIDELPLVSHAPAHHVQAADQEDENNGDIYF